MANVLLPNFDITNNDIDSAGLPQLQKIVKSLLNSTIQLTEELTYLLNNLDTKNVNEIDGDVLVTGTVTAAKMMVEQLSAISANLGKITAGEIYGTYIATRETGYPKAEMSNTQNMFGAYGSSGSGIRIQAVGISGSPELRVFDGSSSLNVFQQGGQSALLGDGDVGILISANRIMLSPGFFGGVYLPFSQLFDTEKNTSLLQQLDAKMDKP